MNLTHTVRLGTFFFGSLLFHLPASANEVEVVNRTDLFGNVANKVKKVGVANPGTKFHVISQKGTWTAVTYNGKSVWVSTKNVRDLASSDSSSGSSELTSSSTPGASSPLSVHAELGLQTGGYGIAPGIGAYYKITNFSPKLRLEVGPSLFFFPSAGGTAATLTSGTSVSALEIMVAGRLLYSMSPKLELGGEFGPVYLNSSVSAKTGTTTSSSSASSIGVNLGGALTYQFAKSWTGLANIRFIMASGTAVLTSAGAQYNF